MSGSEQENYNAISKRMEDLESIAEITNKDIKNLNKRVAALESHMNQSEKIPQRATPPRANSGNATVAPQRSDSLAQAANLLGCFRDQGGAVSAGTSGRDLNGFFMDSPNMTTTTCINECRRRGFAYAGTQYGHQCFCGDSYGRSGTADNCNMACSGSPAEICGGYWANRIYKTFQ